MALTFEVTRDLHLVKLIVTHPTIWPALKDDSDGPPEEYEPSDHPLVYYVLVTEDERILGLLLFRIHGTICWEATIMVVPHGRGRGVEITKAGLAWVFENTGCIRIISRVLKSNRLALRLNKLAGFKVFGVNPKCVMINGKLEDYVLFGVSKSDWQEARQ